MHVWCVHRPTSGFTLIELMIVVGIIAILVAIGIPNLMRSRLQANEASTIQNMRAITSGQTAYHASNGEFATSMEDLTNATPPFVDHDFLQEPLNGYLYEFGGDEINYTLNADAAQWGVTGNRGFFTDASGVIRYNYGGRADDESTPLQ